MRRAGLALLVCAGLALLVCAGCAARVPVPPVGLHSPGDDFATVPYPPPPAEVELLPARPDPRAKWIDGEWQWTGRGYAWRSGRWQAPPAPGATYAPALAIRAPDGTLTYFYGAWHDRRGEPIAGSPR